MNPTPEVRPAHLADRRVHPPVRVAATIIRHFPASRLPEVEAAWAPARAELAASLTITGGTLESGHWDWRNKIGRVEQGELVLIGVECEGAVQGLIAIPRVPRPAVLTPGERLVYVDYLETAPWNLTAPGRSPRFGGVGSALLTEAIIISIEQGLRGRVGLHSLEQAEGFYEAGCKMTRIGSDPSYHNLVYFEYTEEGGVAWLTTKNTG